MMGGVAVSQHLLNCPSSGGSSSSSSSSSSECPVYIVELNPLSVCDAITIQFPPVAQGDVEKLVF
jgi:hypothetical protein